MEAQAGRAFPRTDNGGFTVAYDLLCDPREWMDADQTESRGRSAADNDITVNPPKSGRKRFVEPI